MMLPTLADAPIGGLDGHGSTVLLSSSTTAWLEAGCFAVSWISGVVSSEAAMMQRVVLQPWSQRQNEKLKGLKASDVGDKRESKQVKHAI